MKLADHINYRLMRYIGDSNNILLPNYYYKDFEMDLFRLQRNGYIVEYEIKISRSDYFNDFKKGKRDWENQPLFSKEIKRLGKHDLLQQGKGANKFFFVVPEGLITIDEVPDYAGLIYYQKWLKMVKPARFLHKDKFPDSSYKYLAHQIYWRHSAMKYQKDKTKKAANTNLIKCNVD